MLRKFLSILLDFYVFSPLASCIDIYSVSKIKWSENFTALTLGGVNYDFITVLGGAI